MDQNSHEMNHKRNRLKDQLYIHRAERLMPRENLEDFSALVHSCSGEDYDRDIEFRLLLDCLELLSLGLDSHEVANIFAADVELELKYKRISLNQAYEAKNMIECFSNFDICSFLPDHSFLKNEDIIRTYYEQQKMSMDNISYWENLCDYWESVCKKR